MHSNQLECPSTFIKIAVCGPFGSSFLKAGDDLDFLPPVEIGVV